MVLAEIVSSLGGVKTALDILKGLKKSGASSAILSEIADLQSALIEVQHGIMAANQTHTADVDRVHQLEEEVARLKAWGDERENYELKQIDRGALAYMLKPDKRGSEPPHWLCANCYQDGKKSFLQGQGRTKDSTHAIYKCPVCAGSLTTHWNRSMEWI